MIPKLDLKISLSEFASLYKICYCVNHEILRTGMGRPDEIGLAEYADELEKKVNTWANRSRSNHYKISVKLSVAVTIWDNREIYKPDNMLLAKIDKALVDLKFKSFSI